MQSAHLGRAVRDVASPLTGTRPAPISTTDGIPIEPTSDFRDKLKCVIDSPAGAVLHFAKSQEEAESKASRWRINKTITFQSSSRWRTPVKAKYLLSLQPRYFHCSSGKPSPSPYYGS